MLINPNTQKALADFYIELKCLIESYFIKYNYSLLYVDQN